MSVVSERIVEEVFAEVSHGVRRHFLLIVVCLFSPLPDVVLLGRHIPQRGLRRLARKTDAMQLIYEGYLNWRWRQNGAILHEDDVLFIGNFPGISQHSRAPCPRTTQ